MISLPLEATPFIGRNQELAEIGQRLADPSCRLLTLVGPGGMGKTRLAIAVARQQAGRYSDGICFVPLQAVFDPTQIPAAIAGALGLRLNASDDVAAELHHMLAGINALLVLDNFEQLIDGADLLSRLLSEAPDIRLLVTSRVRLHLIEEWVFDVNGLDVPADEDCDAPASYSAVQLFTSVAHRSMPGFTLEQHCASVVRVCQLLDGMPLAIELAAAWVRLLTVPEIEAELQRGLDILETPARNMPPQHRTMRAVFERSWQMLSPHEQRVFARLSVFAGGFDAAAAQEVADANRLDLAQLLDKSWLRRNTDTGRYSVHELARQFGAEHLSPEKAHAAHTRHSQYYSRFLEARWPEQQGSAYKEAYQIIEAELENVRAAWLWAVDTLDEASLIAARRALWFFFDSGSRFREGAHLFSTSVEKVRAAGPACEALLGRLLARKGALNYSLDKYRAAEENLLECLAIVRRHGLEDDIAFAELELGMNYLFTEDDSAIGRAHIHSALSKYEALDDPWGMAYSQFWMGLSYLYDTGDGSALNRAEAFIQTSEAGFRGLGNQWGLACVASMLSYAAFMRQDYHGCWDIAIRCKQAFAEIEVVWGVSSILQTMVDCAHALGWDLEMRQCIVESLRIELKYQLFNHALQPARAVAELRLEAGDALGALEILSAIEAQRDRLGRSTDPDVLRLLESIGSPATPAELAALERGRTRSFEDILRELIAEIQATLPQPLESASTQTTSNSALDEPLTTRELEILRLVAEGRSNRDIAAELYLSVGTVKTHIHNLTGKLGASNRTEAAATARRLGLIGPVED
ncbi:MAG: LuxR C-terminal-related transcriptional regulator [Anaerolineae bacterium]